MKWLVFNIILIIRNYVISCQDIVFPSDEETYHVNSNTEMVKKLI